ncbi:MAG: hypothetical protein ACLRX4_09590 [Oscillospiraceae bacterium]
MTKQSGYATKQTGYFWTKQLGLNNNLKAFVPDSKKIVVFFDRDNAGKDGVQAITGISKNDGRVAHYQDIVQDNITTSFIPYKDGVTEGDFLIEDYFSWDDTIKAIVEDVIPDRKHPIKMLPNLPDKIKKNLKKESINLRQMNSMDLFHYLIK